jgi:hypothetical protein
MGIYAKPAGDLHLQYFSRGHLKPFSAIRWQVMGFVPELKKCSILAWVCSALYFG